MPTPPAHPTDGSPRPPSAINVAMGDAPDLIASPAERSDDEESVRQSTKSWTARDLLDSQEPGSTGSVRSASEAGLAKAEEEDSVDTPEGLGSGVSIPVQKRRRVTRACDECRRKKIKCDGRSPCTHCSVYSYECTYDKPSNRRRNPAPQYIEALENRLHRAEALLRKYVPDVDLTDPKLDPAVQQEFANRERLRAQQAKLAKGDEATAPPSLTPKLQKSTKPPPSDRAQDANLMSMIETIGHLDLIDGHEWDFHGVSSGAVFLRRLKEQMGLLSHDAKAPFLPRPPRAPGMFNLDSPRSSASSPWESADVPAMYDLPPKEVAMTLCNYSLSCATCLIRIVHVPSFYQMVHRLYEKGSETLGPEDHRQLGLFYSVMALGSMYTSSDDEAATKVHYKTAIEQGLKYYSMARLLLQDITECRDVASLQGLLFMILFLQATSNLSGCYAFLGIALRAALRMGLHRHLPHVKLTPIEDQTRRRVFSAIRQMDIYVSAMLGFPVLLHDDDIDQPLPAEVNDEYVTKDAIIEPPPGEPSFFQAMNAHARLMRILSRVIREIYPVKGLEDCAVKGDAPHATYMISYASIKDVERDLQQWLEQLPVAWRPSNEGDVEVVRVRSLLRFTYAHVQMMLYRPFLHYVSPRLSSGKHTDERYFACAAACISVSRNIIHIGMELRKSAVLAGPYWFILYTEFFAILSLTFYAMENPDKPGTPEILADANAGRELIASLSQRSLAADRVTDGLNTMFAQLPDRIKTVKGQAQRRPIASKKRSAPGSQAFPGLSPAPQQSTEPQRSQTVPDKTPQNIPLHLPMDAVAQRHIHGHPGHPGLPGHPFASNYDDSGALDMLVGNGHPESRPGFHAVPPRAGGRASSQLYNKLDAIMFPSGDPFEYPSQPMMELGGGRPVSMPHQQRIMTAQHNPADPVQQFYGLPPDGAHHVYDDIEGQLLGPLPPYLVQSPSGLDDFAAQLYNASHMMTLQQRHGGGGGDRGVPHPHHQHHPLHHHQSDMGGSQVPPAPPGAGAGQPPPDIDDMLLAESGFGMFPPQQHPFR